jgi:hypothetical protein
MPFTIFLSPGLEFFGFLLALEMASAIKSVY